MITNRRKNIHFQPNNPKAKGVSHDNRETPFVRVFLKLELTSAFFRNSLKSFL